MIWIIAVSYTCKFQNGFPHYKYSIISLVLSSRVQSKYILTRIIILQIEYPKNAELIERMRCHCFRSEMLNIVLREEVENIN